MLNSADVIVIGILVASVYFGWKKGFIVAAIEFGKWVAAIIIARLFHVQFTEFFVNNIWNPTEKISNHVTKYLYDFFAFDPLTGSSVTGNQIDMALDKLKLPPFFQSRVQEAVGSKIIESTIQFVEAVAMQITEIIVHGLGFLLLVILLLTALGIFQFIGNNIAKLPVLKELNQGGGMIIGAMIGVMIVYFSMSLISFFPTFKWTSSAIESIEGSICAIYFYRYNLLQYAFNTILVNGKLIF